MKRRSGSAPADFMVCFPTRAHLKLLPKPICSPSRTADERLQLARVAGKASPLYKVRSVNKGRIRNTPIASLEILEPSSPKVTCAGQIKVRPRNSLEKRRTRGRRNWMEALGLKKDFLHLLAAIRGLRFKLSCFGPFHGSVGATTEEEDDEVGEEEEEEETGNVLSKWFMVLEEEKRKEEIGEVEEHIDAGCSSVAPPPNALLLMRCRSAPANGLCRREEEAEEEEEEEGIELDKNTKGKLREGEEKNRVVLMSYAPNFFKLSSDIVKETWVVGSMDPLVRCRSWKR